MAKVVASSSDLSRDCDGTQAKHASPTGGDRSMKSLTKVPPTCLRGFRRAYFSGRDSATTLGDGRRWKEKILRVRLHGRSSSTSEFAALNTMPDTLTAPTWPNAEQRSSGAYHRRQLATRRNTCEIPVSYQPADDAMAMGPLIVLTKRWMVANDEIAEANAAMPTQL